MWPKMMLELIAALTVMQSETSFLETGFKNAPCRDCPVE
jgi:hypothetical protein